LHKEIEKYLVSLNALSDFVVLKTFVALALPDNGKLPYSH